MGLCRKDLRILYDRKSKDWVIANDYKKRRLMSRGYSEKKAEDESHGHLRNKRLCEQVKENILANKREQDREVRLLGCYVRICDKSYKHYSWVCGLYETRKSKDKQRYFNSGKGVR